jgi:hypothetical protein
MPNVLPGVFVTFIGLSELTGNARLLLDAAYVLYSDVVVGTSILNESKPPELNKQTKALLPAHDNTLLLFLAIAFIAFTLRRDDNKVVPPRAAHPACPINFLLDILYVDIVILDLILRSIYFKIL